MYRSAKRLTLIALPIALFFVTPACSPSSEQPVDPPVDSTLVAHLPKEFTIAYEGEPETAYTITVDSPLRQLAFVRKTDNRPWIRASYNEKAGLEAVTWYYSEGDAFRRKFTISRRTDNSIAYIVTEDADAQTRDTAFYTFNGAAPDRLIEVETHLYLSSSPDVAHVSQAQYRYGADDRLLQETTVSSGGSTWVYTYSYNADGSLKEKTGSDDQGSIASVKFEYGSGIEAGTTDVFRRILLGSDASMDHLARLFSFPLMEEYDLFTLFYSSPFHPTRIESAYGTAGNLDAIVYELTHTVNEDGLPLTVSVVEPAYPITAVYAEYIY